MAELRRDPVSGRWVIIATERASRPQDFALTREEPVGGFCPFCEGNEDRTPPEVYAVRRPGSAPDSPGWKVRVVPNKFPALSADGGTRSGGDELYRSVEGFGCHEVIIESPRHIITPTALAPDDFTLVLQTYCRRFRALSADERLAYVLMFKNVGSRAGASLEHSHSQLIAVPVMPRRVAEEMQHSNAYFEKHGRCIFCDIVERELRLGERVVLATDDFAVLSPYAARFPFEMWVLPRFHAHHPMHLEPAQVAELARVLHEALARLEACLESPPFNYAIHTAPVTGEDFGYYHWHIEVIPRVTQVAGFEWGTGFYINPMEPESAARYLREVARDSFVDETAPVFAPNG
jgi:UDPglucose--hexose-1-phosphate uridylyltransferase